ncbi:uncharacterized protein A4U43_C01F12930 [Asparagus officinalis]|uniref:CDT1 Geminin-binding domain-containing protein n=1 Tax=Asparagus officinalis TaxID=4686 RepID=A0A5P1FTH9_ASPOF|nr:CDT1-like protein a, chloroplastic [Asparagus officinalis]ONK80021.1 uncharacterized protein A4U43_C01F12930 [Asparagus officinalis]
MESRPKSKSKRTNDGKPSIPLASPIKSKPSTSASDQISMPEKPIHGAPRTRNRRMALSIKEVKQIAQGLHRNTRQSSDQSDLVGSDTEQLATEVRKPLRAKTPIKLPEKCEMLAEFFNSMESSIQLLRMKGSPPTFSNISSSIQNMTERRFTCYSPNCPSFMLLSKLPHLRKL